MLHLKIFSQQGFSYFRLVLQKRKQKVEYTFAINYFFEPLAIQKRPIYLSYCKKSPDKITNLRAFFSLDNGKGAVLFLQRTPPAFIRQIPFDGFGNTSLEGFLWLIAQLTLDFLSTYRVTAIVASAISHISDQ